MDGQLQVRTVVSDDGDALESAVSSSYGVAPQQTDVPDDADDNCVSGIVGCGGGQAGCATTVLSAASDLAATCEIGAGPKQNGTTYGASPTSSGIETVHFTLYSTSSRNKGVEWWEKQVVQERDEVCEACCARTSRTRQRRQRLTSVHGAERARNSAPRGASRVLSHP